MGIITEYLTKQQEYEKKYGSRTVVLMAIGVFYEIYEYDPAFCTSEDAKLDKKGNLWDQKIGHAVDLSLILNTHLTHQNNNDPYSIRNPFKIGFPVIAYDKNKNTLLASDYTIIRIDQDPIKKKVRYVSEICSPIMEIDCITPTSTTSNVVSLYIEYQNGNSNKFDNFNITTGVSVFDILTGTNRVCEFYSKLNDPVYAIQELYRFLIAHGPREIIIHVNDLPKDIESDYLRYLDKSLDLCRFNRVITSVNKVNPDFKKLSYQMEFFNRIYTIKNSSLVEYRDESIITKLQLDRMTYGRIAHMLLVEHFYSYNPEFISRLTPPDVHWIDHQKHMILAHNAIKQLDLIPNGNGNGNGNKKSKSEIDSLLMILDHNRTHLGRRLLQNLIQNPLLDPKDIKTYYNMVHEMLTVKVGDHPLWLELDKELQQLPDISRLHRKLQIKLITPKEITVLYHAYLRIINIYICILNTQAPCIHGELLSPEMVSQFNQFIAQFTTLIDFEAFERCNIESSTETQTKWFEFITFPIRKGIYPDLDREIDILNNTETELQIIVDHLNTFITGKKLEFRCAKRKPGAKKTEPNGIIILTTNSKANTLLHSPIDTNLCGVLTSVPYTVNDKLISSSKITNLSNTIDTIRQKFRHQLLDIFYSIINEMNTKYTFYSDLSNMIAKIDLIHSYAKLATLNNYHQPELVTDSGPSFIEARELRHPIIEKIINGPYITNNIFLGPNNHPNNENNNEDNSRTNGLLLFGLNMSGKTSLAKAIALNIIMAQIGCYTACHLRYKPYSKIITRLSGNDNLFRGESTFAIEMNELRTILRQADPHTLVLGNEISSSTETISATGIITSAILSLIKAEATFVFATHVHDVVELPHIKELVPKKLNISHLTVHKDPLTNHLIYERILKSGSGPSTYGILVAESLDLPQDFIDKAYEVVKYASGLTHDIINHKVSRYNSDLYITKCAICSRTSQQTIIHVHHIHEQRLADSTGHITLPNEILHKNKRNNLIALCQECHHKLHSSKQSLETISVTNGTIIRIKS